MIADPTSTFAVWQQQVLPERGTRYETDRFETIVEDALEVFEVHAERYLTRR